jgi:hypothetical protein
VYVSQRTAFGKVAEAFAGWLDPANGVIKRVVEMD